MNRHTPSGLSPEALLALHAGRQIVANLLHRKRRARNSLRRAIRAGASAEHIDRLSCYLAEAHNAAESSRRILYRGIDSL